MNTQTIETVVRRLFSDADFRAQATTDPTTALSGYRLAATEQQALTRLCTQLTSNGQLAATTQSNFWWT